MLIGINGKAGAGKDTIADHLINKYGYKRIALADPIKRLVQDVFALDEHTVYDRVTREQPLKEWPDWTVRKLLQYIGTELFRENIDGAIWVKSLWLKIKNSKDNYVVSDIRFNNELYYLKDNAGENFISIKVIRDGCDGRVGIIGHASESENLQTNYEIINDGTIEYLYNKVDKIMEKL